MLNQSENTIIKINDIDVVLPAEYLSYTYLVATERKVSSMGFFELLRQHPWAISKLMQGNLVINDDVVISVEVPEYDLWAYQPEGKI